MLIKEISIVIPALSEEESLPLLVDDIKNCFLYSKIDYEIIIIDDDSQIPVENYIPEDKIIRIIISYTKDSQTQFLKGEFGKI